MIYALVAIVAACVGGVVGVAGFLLWLGNHFYK